MLTESRITLHEAYCERHYMKCVKCNEMIKKDE